MKPTSYVARGEHTSPRFCSAFAKGCRGPLQVGGPLREGPVALFGSPQLWALLQRAQADGRTWYYGDHAYFGRTRYFRVTRNAYQHDGTASATPHRFEQFQIPIRPWRRTGSHIVICPNSTTYFRLFGLEAEAWVHAVVEEIRAWTDRPILARWKTDAIARPLALDLVDAWAVVVFSSNAAVEALLAGVPVFVLAPFAAARRMGRASLADIERPSYPDDRAPFAWALADRQWTLEELRAGVAWRVLTGMGTPAEAVA